MSVGFQLLLIVLSIGALLAAMAIVHGLAGRYGWSAELQRKSVHVTTGLYALTLPLTFSKAWPVLLLCVISVVVMGAMRLPVLAKSGIGSTIHGVERQSYGELLLVLAIGFTFFRSLGNPVLYVLPILVLTFADAAAAMTGVRYGRRLFAIENGTKSIEGVVMFFLVTFIIAVVTLLLMTDVSRPGVILLSVLIAAFGAQIEAESWRGFDNLFIPVGLQLFLQNNLAVAPTALIGAIALYAAILGALLMVAPRLGLTPHAARGYGILAFLILSITASHNAILPLCAFLGFVILRRSVPCQSPYPDLDFLAAAAVTAAFWLFLGELSGYSAINLYNLTFAGVAALFLTLAVRQRMVLALAVSAGLGLAVLTIAPLNAPNLLPKMVVYGSVGASLALCCLTPILWPNAFQRRRAPRAFALALVVPLVMFITQSFAP